MIIIFSHEVKGHYLEYLHHIYDMCRKMDEEYLFYVPEQFKDIKCLLYWEPTANVKFEYIPQETYKYYMSLGIVKRSFHLSKLLKTQIQKYKSKTIFCCSLITILPYAPFVIQSNVKISGIIYMIYLHRWRELSFMGKFKNVLKYVLMSYSKNIHRILILNDQKSVNKLNSLYRSKKFHYLPDPYVPIQNSNRQITIRKQYCIESEKILFSHFGALNSNKGTLDFLKSLTILPQEISSKSHFFLAGRVDGEIKEEFYQIYDRLKNKISITLIDEFCSYEFLGDLCKESDAIVIPYKRTSQSSGVIGYASQFGKPVIAPDKGLLGDLVRDFKLGITIPDLSATSLINAYKIILEGNYLNPDTTYCKSRTVKLFQDEISKLYIERL